MKLFAILMGSLDLISLYICSMPHSCGFLLFSCHLLLQICRFCCMSSIVTIKGTSGSGHYPVVELYPTITAVFIFTHSGFGYLNVGFLSPLGVCFLSSTPKSPPITTQSFPSHRNETYITPNPYAASTSRGSPVLTLLHIESPRCLKSPLIYTHTITHLTQKPGNPLNGIHRSLIRVQVDLPVLPKPEHETEVGSKSRRPRCCEWMTRDDRWIIPCPGKSQLDEAKMFWF
jgi:hypothetical protein